MSQQTTLNNYFKSRTSLGQITSSMSNEKNIKRRSLSLKKTTTPSKLPRKTSTAVALIEKQEDIIALSSSDSDEAPTQPKNQNGSTQSSKTQNKILPSNSEASFASEATQECPLPFNSSEALNSSATSFVLNLSPSIIWQSPKAPSNTSSSPGSSGKFYSPTKKRIVTKRSPAKKNLLKLFNENTAQQPLIEDEVAQNYGDMDDKTAYFLSIIVKCLKSNSLKNLLEQDSQGLLDKCMHVVKPGMRLMCRLYWRQHGWYRMEELRRIASGKKEVLGSPEMNNMITCLVDCGLIASSGTEGESNLNFDDYVKLLKKPDLQQICKDLKLKIQSKQDAVDALRSYSCLRPISNFYTGNMKNNRTRVLEILKSKTGLCYKMTDLARNTFHNLYVLMYLGIDYSIIREKKLEWILIHDKINRETYPIDKDMVVDDASVVFHNKEEFYRYLQAHTIYESYLEKTDTNQKCEIIRRVFNLYNEVGDAHMFRYKSSSTWLRRYTPPNIYVKILENGVQELKKMKTEEDYNLAVEILDTLIGQIAFRNHKKAEWYAEKALILHSHLDSSKKAAKVLLEGFKSNLSEEAKDAMRPRAKKIANQQNIDLKNALREALLRYAIKEDLLESNLPGEHIYKQPMDNYNQRGKLKFEAHTDEGRSILTAEDYCILHYVGNGQYTHGEHWEGRIVTTLFFLLFWEIIYVKPCGVSGIFLSHYQRYPLDMFSESFYINRKSLIDERLQFIEECDEDLLLMMIQSKWIERPECEISDIQRSIGWDTVQAVASCLQPRGVAAICRRLATNYGYAHSGFPDLTLWNIHTKKIKFVEVKTDADKPSVKQLQWLRYLIDHGIDAGFCYVGVNTTRSRARPTQSQSLS